MSNAVEREKTLEARVVTLENEVASLTERVVALAKACVKEQSDIAVVESNQAKLVRLMAEVVPRPHRQSWLSRVLG